MPKLPPGARFGAIFIIVGLGMMLMMYLDQSGLNVPLWVAEAAAACFAFAGASMLARAFGKLHLASALSLGVVYALAIPGLWIAFGSDGSGCTVSGGIGFFSFVRDAGALSCRLVFGAGAIITVAAAIALTWAVLRRRALPPSDPSKTA